MSIITPIDYRHLNAASITPQTDWRTLATLISEDLFVQELKKKGAFETPLFEGEADPEAAARVLYQDILAAGHSAEMWLAICGREHTWGTNPDSVLWRHRTKSWTNARSVRKPGIVGQRVYDHQRNSHYIKYQSVRDSLADGIYRIEDPTYAYRHAVTLFDLFSVWAPQEDQNDPEAYAWFVCNYIVGLRSRMVPQVPGGESPLWTWVPADLHHYQPGRAGVAWPDTLIQHHTDGWDSLAWLTTSPNSQVSAHHLLNHDATHRAQLVRHFDTAWATGYMNPRSISCEWERKWPVQKEISDSQYQNMARFWADVVRFERVRGNPHFAVLEPHQLRDHNDYYDTICPGNLDMSRLFELVSAELNKAPARSDEVRYFPQTGRYVVLGFRSFWEEMELHSPQLPYRAAGLPLTNEGWGYKADGSRIRVQFFERAVMKWNEGVADPYDLTFALREEVDEIVSFDEAVIDAQAA